MSQLIYSLVGWDKIIVVIMKRNSFVLSVNIIFIRFLQFSRELYRKKLYFSLLLASQTESVLRGILSCRMTIIIPVLRINQQNIRHRETDRVINVPSYKLCIDFKFYLRCVFFSRFVLPWLFLSSKE